MRHVTIRLPLPADPSAEGEGAAIEVRNIINKYVQVQGGSRDYDVVIEWTMDHGTTWFTLFTASGTAMLNPSKVEEPATHLRTRVANYVSEASRPVATLSGFDAEDDP